jgi:hypothetical protein
MWRLSANRNLNDIEYDSLNDVVLLKYTVADDAGFDQLGIIKLPSNGSKTGTFDITPPGNTVSQSLTISTSALAMTTGSIVLTPVASTLGGAAGSLANIAHTFNNVTPTSVLRTI